jgi:hypothetical protein
VVEHEPGHFVRCHLYDPDHAPADKSVWDRMPSASWKKAQAVVDMEEAESAAVVARAVAEAEAKVAAAKAAAATAAASEPVEAAEPAADAAPVTDTSGGEEAEG